MRWRNCKKRGRKQESERKGKKRHAANKGLVRADGTENRMRRK